ncbi:MAG TPA: TIGR03767 family metallophosphoesterase [Nocardioides sp.]|uniref:TIGR03767 family metallophosphoesterase n=1 Tax=Nocardioides sp. TaxID=35761 RepID=UPI002F41CDD6
MTTYERTLRASAPDARGYRRLAPAPGEAHLDRQGRGALIGDEEVLVTIAQLSDLHVCDAQSPARAELLDRWADPDSPIGDVIGEVGTYRAQEMLTTQVVEAMVRALNDVRRGPLAGAPVDAALVTGDNTDNMQANELGWYLTLLDGGEVSPDSGDPTRWEGVAAGTNDDDRYWHPDRERSDLPRSRYGFPVVPGLLDAARETFRATGLDHPWLAVHGNHDRLLQGTLPSASWWARIATGSRHVAALWPDVTPQEVLELVAGLDACEPEALERLARGRTVSVTPDRARRATSREEFVAAHDHPAARPPRHGFAVDGRLYYRHDLAGVRLLVMDTVNPSGGWQGSVDREQFGWLSAELGRADAERAYVVLASHHPLDTWINDRGDPTRVLAPEMTALLAGHPSVVLWLNGHTHRAEIQARDGWWEVTCPSLIDWPQQGRIVEMLRGDGVLRIGCTMVDHGGDAPWSGSIAGPAALAGLSRELAANDWQADRPDHREHPPAGRAHDRNVVLTLPDPWPDPPPPGLLTPVVRRTHNSSHGE